MSHVMNIIDKLHQQLVVDRIKSTEWKGNGSTAPLVVEFDTTEVCNLACPGCISEDLVSNQTSFSNKRLMELAEEMYMAGVKAVILIGGGEPLAHPKVGDFIEYLGKHDVKVGITTNGCFIDRYFDVIAEYSSWTRVSMDAATEKTFGKLRPAKSKQNEFAHIIDNMRQLSRLKQGELGFSYLIRTEKDGFGIESNISEIYEAAVLARDIGCDYFEIKPSYSYSGGMPHALVEHNSKDMEQASDLIKRLSDLESDSFRIVKAINLADSLNGVRQHQIKMYHRCPMAELRTLVTPSGVYVCPYWRGKVAFNLGDAKENSFLDIWNSSKRQDVVAYTDPHTVCKFHCLRHQSNLEVLKLIDTPAPEIKIVPEYDRFI